MNYITPEYIDEASKIQDLIEPKDMYDMKLWRAGTENVSRSTNSSRLSSYDIFLPDLRWLVRKLRNLTDELGWDFKFGPVEDGFWWVLVYDRERNRIPFEADTPELACLKALIELIGH